MPSYRAGLIELNESDSVRNKYTIAPITWVLRCTNAANGTIEAHAEVDWPNRRKFRLQLSYAGLGDQVYLSGIDIAPLAQGGQTAKERFLLSGFELRANEQRRGQPIREGMISPPGEMATFRIDPSETASVGALMRGTLNSQWLDVPARLENKPHLLSFELPDLATTAAFGRNAAAR